MPEPLTSREIAPGRWLIALSGTLDPFGEDALADALGRATAARASWIGLDLGEVLAMDGGGLSLLVRFGAWCREQQLRPELFRISPRARRVLSEQGLEAAMSLHRDGAPGSGESEGDVGPPRSGQEICPPGAWACGLGRVPNTDPDGSPMPANVAGRAAATPMEGFGQLWHKVYRLRLGGIETTPQEAAGYLQSHLGELWPPGNHLRLVGTDRQLVPGAVGHIQLRLPGGAPLSTGVRVLHRSPTSLTFVTLRGHMEAGWITFAAHDEGGTTVVRVESLARTGDPMYEVGFQLFGHGQQEGFWRHTLTALARHLGVAPRIQVVRTLVDATRNWDGTRNLTANAALGTATLPLFRLLRRGKP
ncbi:MAG TPA: STAS domain-containing protein [Deferrisomatales bacterium]|nr:STAS domain-containing protein [Deferrisomatales bacterium]